MKSITYFLFSLLAFVACASCEKSTQETPEQSKYGETITLKVGETVVIEANTLSVNFQEVVEDSRCPKGVECFWEGRAVVQLMVNEKEVVELIMQSSKLELAKDTLNNTVYTLLSVLPETNANLAIKQEDYVIDVQVDKLK